MAELADKVSLFAEYTIKKWINDPVSLYDAGVLDDYGKPRTLGNAKV